MANGYTPDELQFMDNHAEAINAGAGNLPELISDARRELGPKSDQSWKKMAILLTYLFYGKEGFRLNIIKKGLSKSKRRAEAGQIRFGIKIEINTDKTGPVEDFVLSEMKGTLSPSRLKDALRKPLLDTFRYFLLNPFLEISEEIIDYLMSTTNFPT